MEVKELLRVVLITYISVFSCFPMHIANAGTSEASVSEGLDLNTSSRDIDADECRYEEQPSPLSQTRRQFQRAGVKGDIRKSIGDHQCFISVDAAIGQWKENKRLIIDTRPSDQWTSLHITGSLNIPAGDIHTKNFLKNRPIALVDKGENPYAMETLCMNLKDNGFEDVKIILGGLSEWRWNGPLRATTASLDDLMGISAKDFISAQYGNAWVLVGIEFDPDTRRDDFGSIHSLMYEGRIEPVIEAVRSEAAQLQLGGRIAVLFMSKDGHYDKSTLDLERLRRVAHVYLLEGGLRNYLEYMETRKKMVAHLNQEPKKIKRCGR